MYNDTNKSKLPKLLLIIIPVILILIIATIITIFVISLNYTSTHSAELEFFVRPTDATVLLDGEPIDISSGLVRVTPGDHSIAIIRAGFFPEGEEFSIKEGEVRDFDYALSPYTEEAKKLAEEFEY